MVIEIFALCFILSKLDVCFVHFLHNYSFTIRKKSVCHSVSSCTGQCCGWTELQKEPFSEQLSRGHTTTTVTEEPWRELKMKTNM